MTKSALPGAARELARDFGARSTTVNVVQSSPTDTDTNPADGPKAEAMHAVIVLKRHGKTSEVAEFVLFLASSSIRGVTGAMYTIDGRFGT